MAQHSEFCCKQQTPFSISEIAPGGLTLISYIDRLETTAQVSEEKPSTVVFPAPGCHCQLKHTLGGSHVEHT